MKHKDIIKIKRNIKFHPSINTKKDSLILSAALKKNVEDLKIIVKQDLAKAVLTLAVIKAFHKIMGVPLVFFHTLMGILEMVSPTPKAVTKFKKNMNISRSLHVSFEVLKNIQKELKPYKKQLNKAKWESDSIHRYLLTITKDFDSKTKPVLGRINMLWKRILAADQPSRLFVKNFKNIKKEVIFLIERGDKLREQISDILKHFQNFIEIIMGIVKKIEPFPGLPKVIKKVQSTSRSSKKLSKLMLKIERKKTLSSSKINQILSDAGLLKKIITEEHAKREI